MTGIEASQSSSKWERKRILLHMQPGPRCNRVRVELGTLRCPRRGGGNCALLGRPIER